MPVEKIQPTAVCFQLTKYHWQVLPAILPHIRDPINDGSKDKSSLSPFYFCIIYCLSKKKKGLFQELSQIYSFEMLGHPLSIHTPLFWASHRSYRYIIHIQKMIKVEKSSSLKLGSFTNGVLCNSSQLWVYNCFDSHGQ